MSFAFKLGLSLMAVGIFAEVCSALVLLRGFDNVKCNFKPMFISAAIALTGLGIMGTSLLSDLWWPR